MTTPQATKGGAQRVVAMGIFDGVHLGHQKLLTTMSAIAREKQAVACALSFHPHPASLLAPKRAPLLLQPLAVRLETLQRFGAQEATCLAFTPEIAQMGYEAFIDAFLLKKFNVAHVVVGDDFAFGKGRAGTCARFEEAAKKRGFGVTFVGAVVGADNERVSSTRIRAFVCAGEMQRAHALLGREFVLYADVGTEANVLRRIPDSVWPRAGVYRGAVDDEACELTVRDDTATLLFASRRRAVKQRIAVTLYERTS